MGLFESLLIDQDTDLESDIIMQDDSVSLEAWDL